MPKRIFELKKTTFGEKKSIATTKENTEPYQHKAAAVTVRTSRKKKKTGVSCLSPSSQVCKCLMSLACSVAFATVGPKRLSVPKMPKVLNVFYE